MKQLNELNESNARIEYNELMEYNELTEYNDTQDSQDTQDREDIQEFIDLPPSRLGTKDYWDQVYQMELDNFLDHGDEGEIWFGRSVERRTIDWIKSKLPNHLTEPRILDLGCGNGHFTLKLLEAGFRNVAALDYSEKAVEFARNLIISSESESEAKIIGPLFDPQTHIFRADILDPESIPSAFSGSFDLIVDKGTFDAISLNPDFNFVREEGLSKTAALAASFKQTLQILLDPLSSPLFIITSCNWTASELETIFGPEFSPIDQVIHSSFTFAGKSGHDVSTVIFKKSH